LKLGDGVPDLAGGGSGLVIVAGVDLKPVGELHTSND